MAGMKVHVIGLPGGSGACKRGIRRLAEFLCLLAGRRWPDPRTLPGEVCVILAGNASTRGINRQLFDSPDTTDVMSLRYDPSPGTGGMCSGEVVVNVERAIEEGPRRGGADRELALYVAHGIDHLSGEEDGSARGYARMRRRELRWLKAAAGAGLLHGLVASRRAGTGKAARGTACRQTG